MTAVGESILRMGSTQHAASGLEAHEMQDYLEFPLSKGM